MDLELSLNALAEGIQLISPEWRYVYLNDAAARQGRSSCAALLGRTMLECYPGIETTELFATLTRCMRDRTSASFENEFTYESGQRAWFDLRIHPCAEGLVILSLDMTARKSEALRLEAAYTQALRDLITPIVRVHAGVLLLPLVGALDAERASRIAENLLRRVVADAAKVVIIDVAGVPVLDAAVANHLLETTAMLRLLGSTALLTGLSAEAARSIVQHGLDLSSIETTSHLAEGIEQALARVGRAVMSRR